MPPTCAASVVIAAVDDTAGLDQDGAVKVADPITDFGREEAVEPLNSIGPVSGLPIGTTHADRVRRAWRPQ